MPQTNPVQISESLAQPQPPPAGQFAPTHRIRIDLWVRAGVPRYSFRTGKWILGEPIGVLRQGSEIQVIDRKVVGFAQSWLKVLYRLPDGRIEGGSGHWIWAGSKDTEENIAPFSGKSNSGSSTSSLALSFVGEAWAQADTIPDFSTVSNISAGYSDEYFQQGERYVQEQQIEKQLDSWIVGFYTFVGFYVFLLLGMIIGSAWEWITSEATDTAKLNGWNPLKSLLRIVTGSIISFSIFILPIMGVSEMAITFSSAILAFHFGIVHSDPTSLVLALKQRYLTR